MRTIRTLSHLIRSANIDGLRLALESPQFAREYVSTALQKYGDLKGTGLRRENPLTFLYTRGWACRRPDQRVEIPVGVETSGGTRLEELLILATVTAVLAPTKIFEIGTFMGQTTSVFVLNAPNAKVVTLDLPPDLDVDALAHTRHYLDTDLGLVSRRQVGSFLLSMGLTGRYEQIFSDTMLFDPAAHMDSVELGFIDGAHSLEYVVNDTRKMGAMMKDRGLVFWHDYGGKGTFGDLTDYLDGLSRTIQIFRVPNTSLAWAPASELKKAI